MLDMCTAQLQMLLFSNALCCSLYERNCVRAVTKIFTKFLPANNFCQLLRVTRKRSCTSAGNAQAQLHFQDDQQRAFGISNISNYAVIWALDHYPQVGGSNTVSKAFLYSDILFLLTQVKHMGTGMLICWEDCLCRRNNNPTQQNNNVVWPTCWGKRNGQLGCEPWAWI